MNFNWTKILVFLLLLNSPHVSIISQENTSIENVISGTKLQNYTVLCITQDSQGFIWVGTNWGLYKYDGYRFKEYLVTTTPSLINNNVKTLLVDGENLWVGTKGGITIINTRTNETRNLPSNSLADDYVTKLFRDANSTIWVAHFSNKMSKHIVGNKFQHYSITEGNPNDYLRIKDVQVTKDNTFYLKMTSEIYKYTTIVELNENTESNSITSRVIVKKDKNESVFLFCKNSLLYLINKNKLYKYDKRKKALVLEKTLFKKDSVTHSALFVDSNSTIFLGSRNNSFYNLNENTLLPEKYTLINDEKSWVNTFFVDKTGLIWVGTSNGIFKIKRREVLFKKYLNEPFVGNRNKMRAILQDSKGDIYTVNQHSIFKYDTLKKNFKNLNWIKDKFTSNPYELIENDNNTLLVGTQNSGIIVYNKTTNSCEPYLKQHQKLLNNHITKLLNDKNEILWIGTLEGLYYLNKKKDILFKMQTPKANNINNIKETVFDIKPFNNNLWVGTSTGLYLVTIDYSKYPLGISVKKNEKVPYSIRSILMNGSSLWIATHTQGVIKYNYEDNVVEQISETDGLSNNTVYSIVPGANNDLWFGTFNGLSRYDTINKQFLNYFDYDGLADNEFNSSSQLVAKNGQIFLGGQNGVSSFYPHKLNVASTMFKLNISTVNWYNSKEKKAINYYVDNSKLNTLHIPYNTAFVNFEFSLTDYFLPKKTTFKYRIKGLRDDWRVLNKPNILSFTNFPPGDYFLEVKASTNYGKWNMQSISLPISVNQVFYKRWWFYIVWGLLTLLFFYMIRKYELNHIKKIEQLRLRISRDLHDELGSSLTGIAIRAELLKEEIGEIKKEEFLNEISTQSRFAVDSLSDIVWALDSTNNSIGDLYDRMESVLFQLLTPLKINYSFQPLKGMKKYISLNQDYRQHIFLIFKEAITNIVKHSNATNVDVIITKEVNKLKLTIKDNGTNVPKCKDKLNGHGIENIKLRAKKIKGKIKIDTTNGFKLEIWFGYISG